MGYHVGYGRRTSLSPVTSFTVATSQGAAAWQARLTQFKDCSEDADLGFSASVTDSDVLEDGVTGVWHILGSLQRDVDQDGDGRPDGYSPGQIGSCPGRPAKLPVAPTDLCPLGADQSDADGDHVYGACDPDPYYRNTYVAGGSPAWPTVPPPPPKPLFGSIVGVSPGGGFWDSDQDRLIEGEDLCPTVPGGGSVTDPYSNWNSWGERLQFQEADGARDPGFFYRGNLCDPYPSTRTSWTETGVAHQDHKCVPFPRYESGGANVYEASVSVQAGRSANDPNPNAPDNRRFQVQPFRCACPSGSVEDCLERDTSPCFGERLLEAIPGDAAGSFWRPVQRPGCAQEPNGYCSPMTLPNGASSDVSWDWVKEFEDHPTHFPAGSVTVAPALDPNPPFAPTGGTEYSAGPYALWTATVEGESFQSPPGLAFSTPANARFPEPERTDPGAALVDVASPESRSLRSAFAPPVDLQSGYVRWLPPGSDCQLPPLIDPCAVASCDWLQWWNWLVFPPDIARVGGGLLHDWTIADAWYWQRRGDRLGDTYLATREVSDLRAQVEEPDHWSAERPGHVAILNAGQAAPALMFVELSDTAARWVLMQAVAQDTVFRRLAEGDMPTAVTNQARLISDPRGQGAVLLDPELNAFLAFDFVLRQWLPQDLPSVTVFDLVSSAPALSGTQLYTAPRANSPGWIVDVYTGAAATWTLPELSRTGARLTPTLDGNGLLFAGGTDQAGPHDDVWLVPFGSDAAPSPIQLVSDSSSPNPKASARALLGYSYGGPVLSVGSDAEGVGISLRSSSGSQWSSPVCLPPDLTSLAAFASSQLWVGAGAGVHSHGSWASVASQGNARIGVGAELGSITTDGGISIGFGARLAGDVTASGSVVNHGVVSGEVRQHASMGLSGLGCFDVVFSPATEGAWVAPRASRAVAPGSYTAAKVLPRGTLRLRAGSYFFKRFEVSPLARVELDTTDGPIRIYVQEKLVTLGDWADATHGAERLLVGYFGVAPLTLVRPFAGTLIAPHASVVLANWEPNAFTGAFFAQKLNLLPGTQLDLMPFRGEILP